MFTLALTALLLVPAVLGQACSRSYTVVEGDVCDGISAAHNVSTYQLAVSNVGKIDATCSNLQPGQALCLGVVGEDCTQTAVVQAGDTCDALEQTWGLNSTLLWTNNPQIDAECGNIYIGEVLCIAPTVLVPAAPTAGIPTAVPVTATLANPAPAATAAAVSSSAAPAYYVPPVPIAPSASVSVSTSTSSTATATPAPTATPAALEGDDEDQLPWCDEL